MYISGDVSIRNNVVTTEIRGTVKNELVGTNTRLEAIENELGRITSHLATIAEALQAINKNRSEKPHRHTAQKKKYTTRNYESVTDELQKGFLSLKNYSLYPD